MQNLGLLYVASAIRNKVPEVEIQYIDACVSRQKHLAAVRDRQPRIYGLSFASIQASAGFRLIETVKRLSPRSIIICGGPHPTVDPEDVLINSPADVCCIGEGEVTVPELIAALIAQQDLREIPGIAFRDWNGSATFTPRRRQVMDLDLVAYPAWDLVMRKKRTRCDVKRNPLSASVLASRGCPWNCSFCSNPVWRISRPWVRKRSPEDIVSEVETLYYHGVRDVHIRSDELNCDLRWAIQLLDMLADLGHSDLAFRCNLRARPITPDFAGALRRANCVRCHVGIVSASARVLQGTRTGITMEDISHALRMLKREKIHVSASMMMFQAWESEPGLEIETVREVLQSMRLALSLRKSGMIDDVIWTFATPYPGSELWRVARQYCLIRHHAGAHWKTAPLRPPMKLPGLSFVEMLFCKAMSELVQKMVRMSAREPRLKKNLSVPLRSDPVCPSRPFPAAAEMGGTSMGDR
jgi:radical SAM superfamily enzyme YgiQ (UPF0313 family)